MMRFFNRLSRRLQSGGRKSRRPTSSMAVESMEQRTLLTAAPLPVLMVIADTQDFYYQEYGDTRASLEAAGVEVDVAATTLTPSVPHANTGEGPDGGIVVPDLTLAQANADDYSAILFVGGWGSSMYQYAFPGTYYDGLYNGDPATKEIVNNLINDFVDQDKYVTAICHATTVLAWARVDGVSPVQDKQISVPYIGSPGVFYNGQNYGYFELLAYEQIVANGGMANTVSGQYGDPATVADDVVVDGRIITAENYDSATMFGQIVAQEVIAAANVNDPPVNHAPIASDAAFQLAENSVAGTIVGTVSASDVDAGQSLTFQITSGNSSNAFAIDAASGQITVSNSAALDFETSPLFQLTVAVVDSGTPSMSDEATVTIQLQDVYEPPAASVLMVGTDLVVQGSAAGDSIFLWSGATPSQVVVRMNGVPYGPFSLPAGGRTIVRGGDGNDRIFADNARAALWIFGERGHDNINGGTASDFLDGGDGYDRIRGNAGNDHIRGGSGIDFLYGMAGSDILVGGTGNDVMEGGAGNDFLFGGHGSDYMKGDAGDDLLIGDRTTYDNNTAALRAIRTSWNAGGTIAQRQARLTTGINGGYRLSWGSTVLDDFAVDTLCSGEDSDLFFAGYSDALYGDPLDGIEQRS